MLLPKFEMFCYACDGSGEGYREGSRCLKCLGLGTILKEQENEPVEKRTIEELRQLNLI
jgi:DnaJ-class molecular chaperone